MPWQALEKEGWSSEEERAYVQASVRGVANIAALLQLAVDGG